MTISENLFNLMAEIRVRPGMHLGTASLKALWHFTNGYSAKEYEIGDSCKTAVCLRDFARYVNNVYELHLTTKSVYRIISENTQNDEEAFYKFFELLDEYLKSQNGTSNIQLD